MGAGMAGARRTSGYLGRTAHAGVCALLRAQERERHRRLTLCKRAGQFASGVQRPRIKVSPDCWRIERQARGFLSDAERKLDPTLIDADDCPRRCSVRLVRQAKHETEFSAWQRKRAVPDTLERLVDRPVPGSR